MPGTHQTSVRSGRQIRQQRKMEFLVSKSLVREAAQDSDEIYGSQDSEGEREGTAHTRG